jgi:hypothetical protein
MARPPDVHRGRHALPRQRPGGLHRRAPPDAAARRLRRQARAFGGPGPDGLPQLPAEPERAVRERLAKSWNMRLFKHLRREADKASLALARKRAPARTPPSAASWSASRTSWPSPRPPRSRSSAAAPRPASSRSRPTSTPTRPCRARSRSRTPIWRSCSRRRARTPTRCGTRSWSTRARCSTSTSSARTRRTSTRPPSNWTSAGWSNWPPTARRKSARASRSTSSSPATSISGTCTCCTGRPGSAA